MEDHIIILGAGISGLVAARELAGRKRTITLLEARQRIGGRIHTVMSATGNNQVELGAEFVHGSEHATWQFLRAARIHNEEVPDRHWSSSNGHWRENLNFWDSLSQVTDRINEATPDQDFQSFIDQAWSLPQPIKRLAQEYVEGFHAADAGRISVHALAQSEAAAEREEGTRQFRVVDGYSQLLQWIWKDLRKRDVQTRFGVTAKQILWEPGRIEILARTEKGPESFTGRCVICTLPLSVLQHTTADHFLDFSPSCEKEKAIAGLAMGQVCKITLQFRERFWPVDNFGFLHSHDRWFPTWWSSSMGLFLTGWAGGPRARSLNLLPPEEILAEAVKSLSELCQLEAKRIHDLLVSSYTHNWQTDPCSLGAYSYTPEKMMEAPRQLGAPVEDTLFFAGEATDVEGGQGTVQGAIRSGQRVAQEVKKALKQKVAAPINQQGWAEAA